MPSEVRRATIARLNDSFRASGEDGWVFLSRGVAALPIAAKDEVIRAVRLFDAFTPDNDPYGEHDCAVLAAGGERIIWKIDYYPRDRSRQSDPDPADPGTAMRVMTIMLAEEY